MTIIAAQCRLSSTRLSRKALLPLGGKTVLDWTLAAMKKVNVDDYYVATDEDSFDEEAIRAEAEKPWNKDDLDRLSFYFERQMDIQKIAERFGKSIYSVQYQLSKLGLM